MAHFMGSGVKQLNCGALNILELYYNLIMCLFSLKNFKFNTKSFSLTVNPRPIIIRRAIPLRERLTGGVSVSCNSGEVLQPRSSSSISESFTRVGESGTWTSGICTCPGIRGDVMLSAWGVHGSASGTPLYSRFFSWSTCRLTLCSSPMRTVYDRGSVLLSRSFKHFKKNKNSVKDINISATEFINGPQY